MLYESWGVTQSLSNPSSFASATFAGRSQEHLNFPQHSQDGGIIAPETAMGTGSGSPLPLPTPESRVDVGSTVYSHGFPSQILSDGSYSFGSLTEPQLYPLDQFPHPSSGTEAVGALEDDEDSEMWDASPVMVSPPQAEGLHLSEPLKRFRFHATLNAPTAMVKRVDEIPVTYLNKGQPYSMTIVDTLQTTLGSAPVKYRTTIFISFDDPQQRRMPATCWRLWAEGRGASEAHKHGGILRAIEYVEANQPKSMDTASELESAAFNKFSVLWSPGSSSSASCRLRVRFNFLSTDFSLSKGVKGMANRISAKTEFVDISPVHSFPEISETCFCKVKIFRDHGAERKITNDIKHVRRTIDRLNERMSSVEAGTMAPGKRRGSESAVSGALSRSLPGDVPKYERSLSLSLASSTRELVGAEESLQSQIQALLDMLNSGLPISTLNLRGEEQDDPDFHPVDITTGSRNTRDVSTEESDLLSPLNSFLQAQPGGQIQRPSYSTTTKLTLQLPPTAHNQSRPRLQQPSPQHLPNTTDQPVWIQKKNRQDSASGPINWMEVLDIDPTYGPPPALSPTSVACFYVRRDDGDDDGNQTTTGLVHPYRAVYLLSRDAQELKARIATKFGFETSLVRRVVRVNGSGHSALVDDDLVRQIPEGQVMGLRVEGAAEGGEGASGDAMVLNDQLGGGGDYRRSEAALKRNQRSIGTLSGE
ncbi:hypothetical protein GP486_000299 [Trichoglossum hirsutum]|uniref:Grh/CP2 DB domain-containing protein n=1 Tax=Trichoglossum hirsutum TaxID=265104 RepID=A0A9P8LJ76_9PEZI|nr:hypothetical protein GP486_000299 [Trichoglossum hirsutum]